VPPSVPHALAPTRRLLPVLLVCLALAPPARAEPAGYALDAAAGLLWQVELSADDGASSASDTLVFFCCADNDALVLGDRVGIVDPTFTPHTLMHGLEFSPTPLAVGVHPVTLDLRGWLTWSPSGPVLMTGESAPIATGGLSGALFTGTLTTPFESLSFRHNVHEHVGGDTTLRRFSGATDLGPPRLRLSSASEPIDTLEVDENDVAGRVEMRNPYEVVLTTTQDVVEAGSVTYALDGAAGLFWEITVTGDDGVQPPSSDTFVAFQGLDASVVGETTGVVDPVFTLDALSLSIVDPAIALTVGAHPVTLDLTGSLEWSPGGLPLASGQEAAMPTGDASAASFAGVLTTPFGSLPFDLGLADHQGGDLALARFSGSTELGPPRVRLDTTFEPLDLLEIDEADQAGRVDLRNPYEAVVGSAGGVTWSISARVYFNDAFHAPVASAPNGAVRDVTWSMRAEVLFNDVFYRSAPDLVPPPVPSLGASGRVLLAAAIASIGLAQRRLRRTRAAAAALR
jgi:hypothetical protein